MAPPRVSVQGSPRDAPAWRELARRVEQWGFEGLYVADHPGTSPSPFVALAAAASVTDRIELGTYVVNAGVWEPVALANEVATLDLVSDGRVVLGVGAGHTPVEWTSSGRAYPSPGRRVDRMIELTELVTRLLSGERLSHDGDSFTLVDAGLGEPFPLRPRVPLLIGGNGRRVLRYGAEVADRVGLTGTGRTLADGHSHEVDWSPAGLRRTVDTVRSAAAGRPLELDVLVQHVEITDDAEQVAASLATLVPGAEPADLLTTPYVWVGTAAEIAGRLAAHRRDHGIDRYTVRPGTLTDVEQVLALLRGR